MQVLQLTNAESPFFEAQLAALRANGVTTETLAVPGTPAGRGVGAYARFQPSVLTATAFGDYDVVHANYGLLGPAALAQPSRPIVLSLWGSDVMGADWLRRVSVWAARGADAVVAPSRALADAVPFDVTVVPFGVDAERFRPTSRASARAAVGWPADETVALFPYDPGRDVKDFPLAESVVARADADVTLRCVSGVSHDRMPDYFNASDLVLVTSRRESGPMVVKEAAACGVPVVSTDVGFVAEVLADVEGSHVASSEVALARALDDVVAAGPRGVRERERAAATVLSIEEMGARLRAVYERVL